MTHATLLVSLILTFAPPPPAVPQSCSLPGLWLGQDRDQNAVGLWLEFAEDGSVVRAQGKIVDGTWEMKGDTLVLTTRPAASTEGGGRQQMALSQRVALKISGDAITRKAEAAILEVPRQEVRTRRGTRTREVRPASLPVPPITVLEEQSLARVTAAEAGQPPLVGIWGYKNASGRPVLERYTASRRFAVLEPMGAQRATYKVTSSTLAVTADDQTTEVGIICGRDAFDLETPGGKMRFAKFW